MKSNFKTKLLLGAAVTALSFGAVAEASAQTTLSGNTTLGAGDLAAHGANDDINLNGFDLLINSSDNTAIGDITDTNATPDGDITYTTSAGGDITQTVGSIDNGTGSLTIVNTAADGDIAMTITNAMTIGSGTTGDLNVTNGDTTTEDAVSLTVGGNATVAGTTTITGNAAAAETATLNVNGATNTFTGGIVLDDGAAGGNAILNFGGSAAQSVTGTINAASATDEGTVNVLAGTNLVTFNSQIGATGTNILALNVGSAAAGGNARFDADVYAATTTVLGENADDAAADFNGNIFGNLVVTTGGTAGELASATLAGNVTGNITLNNGGGADVATVTFDGTSLQTVTGNVTTGTDDDGLINVNNDVTITGTIGATDIGQVNVATGKTLTYDTAAQTIGVDTTAITGTGIVVVDSTDGTGAVTLDGAVTAATDGAGTLRVTGAENVIVSGAVGTSTNDVGAIQVNSLADNGTLTFQGNTYTNGVSIDAAADAHSNTVTFGNGADTTVISGNITSAENGEHTLVFNSSTDAEVTGNIGTSAADFAAVTVTESLKVGGNLYANTLEIANTKTLTFNGTTAQTVTAVIDGDGAGQGSLTVGNGTSTTDVTFTGTIGTPNADLAAITVSDNAVARFNANATTDGTLTNTGTTRVGAGATVEAGVLTDTGSYVLAASDADTTDALAEANFGRLDDTGNNGTLTASRVSIDVQSQLATGTVELAEGINLGAATLADNSFQYSFVVANAGANSNVTVSRRTLEDIADGSQLTNGAAETLDGLIASTDTEIAAINANLAAASSQEAVNDILESVSPTVDAGAVVGATGFTTQTSNITNTQLASLRDGTEATGMYAGNVTNGLRGWVQGFGLTGDQDERDGVSGYDVDSYGVAVGLDTQSLADNWIWGLAFAYSDTDVDSDGVNNTNTDIDNYQVSVYANYDLDDRTYIAGQAGYVWGDNDQTRYNVGGVSGLTADADYDSDVIFAGLEAGRKYMVGGNTVLTPKALINYQHYDADGYTETGAGGANLTTSGDELDLFEIGVGVDASWDYQQADGSYLQPKIGVGVRHDLVGDEYQTTSTFAAGGSSFETEGFDPAQTTFNVSADVTYFSTTNWELSAGYDFEIKSDYDSHAGTLKAAYKF